MKKMRASDNPCPIWMYWRGPMPDYIRFCVETVRRHHPGRVVFATERHENEAFNRVRIPAAQRQSLCVQHVADIVRGYLLRAYGGYWIDCDFLCLAPIDGLFDPEQARFAAYKRLDLNESLHVESVDNDFIWAPHDTISPIANEFLDRIAAVLHGNNFKVPSWAGIGANILSAMLATKPPGFAQIPFQKITWLRGMAKQFDAYAPEEVDKQLPEDIRGVMLIHSLSAPYLGQRTLHEIVGSRTVVGSLFRCAIRRLSL